MYEFMPIYSHCLLETANARYCSATRSPFFVPVDTLTIILGEQDSDNDSM